MSPLKMCYDVDDELEVWEASDIEIFQILNSPTEIPSDEEVEQIERPPGPCPF